MPSNLENLSRNIQSLEEVTAEIESQWDIYTARGFHDLLGVPKGALKDKMIRLAEPQPERFRGMFNIPVAVFGNIPISEQCSASGIVLYYDPSLAKDWSDDPLGYKTPKQPYLAWIQPGLRYVGVPIEKVRRSLLRGERFATQHEAIGFAITDRDVFSHKAFIDFPGTTVQGIGVPRLYLDKHRIELFARSIVDTGLHRGSATSGR